ncbi:MAG: internalization-like protein competence protein ComEC/Rec2, competence protein ComEC protein [Candidatus Adlerbacteria bacterium]|nr:internalization-like protein competence protein ComEC/Rec2, competence protein ComEC protein [Candidatus Adlerbacteria bacterium]
MTWSVFKRHAGLLLVAALALVVSVIWLQVHAAQPPNVLTVAVLDIGQGDAIFIESPTGKQVLVDSGPDNSVLNALSQVMPITDRSIDVLIETHPDADHIGGYMSVLERYEVGMFLEPGIAKDSTTAKSLEAAIDEHGVARYVARRGMVIDLGGGAELDILYPDHDVSRVNPNLANNGGIVMHLVYGETSMLLTADVDSSVEDTLLVLDAQDPAIELDSDILKVGHHGSKYSSEDVFLKAVSPAVALISVGAHNTYGHPTKEALGRLQAEGVEVHRTDQEGTIIYVSNGQEFVRK